MHCGGLIVGGRLGDSLIRPVEEGLIVSHISNFWGRPGTDIECTPVSRGIYPVSNDAGLQAGLPTSDIGLMLFAITRFEDQYSLARILR